jgi:hypothetical protein
MGSLAVVLQPLSGATLVEKKIRKKIVLGLDSATNGGKGSFNTVIC